VRNASGWSSWATIAAGGSRGTRRGQLDRERQSVQPAADLGDRGGVRLVQAEAGQHRGRACHEERHGGIAGDRRQVRPPRIRQRQRRYRIGVLAAQAQRRPAGGEYLQRRTGGQQVRHVWPGVEQVLHVVQHQQARRPEQVVAQRRRRPSTRLAQPERLGHGAEQQPRLGDVGQRHELRYETGFAARELQRQPRLAAPARPGQRQQAHIRPLHEAARGRQLALPPDERGERHRQRTRRPHLAQLGRGRDRGGRRGAASGCMHLAHAV
jgi:hypothetical protein